MSPSSSTRPATDSLIETTNSALTLLQRFTSALSNHDPSEAQPTLPANPPDPLDVLHTSATLLKAHTTKLSLLIINKPFTPSALRSVISDVASSCIPAMMSAVEICGAQVDTYGQAMYKEAQARVRRVFREMESLLQEVVGLVDNNSGEASSVGTKRDSLASTGVVWEACDALMELKGMGLAGLVVKKALEYKEMVDDAIAELKEWAEEEAEDDEEDEAADGFEESDDEDSFEKMLGLGEQKRLPRSREDLKETLAVSLKKLRLTSTLYQAVVKRRLKTIPSTVKTNPAHVSTVDRVNTLLQETQEHTDELAGAFYALNDENARTQLAEVCRLGTEVVKLLSKTWKEEEDEFTEWSSKWREALKKD